MRLTDYHIYILQLENYDLARYWKALFGRGYIPGRLFVPRQKIIWTAKLIFVTILSLFIMGATFFGVQRLLWSGPWYLLLAIAYGLVLLNPFFLSVATIFLWPLDFAIKKYFVFSAKRKISRSRNLSIIGIAGSYGKTTVKECVAAAVGAGKRVLKTPENINTPLGIARLIKKTPLGNFDVFIVEMGEYHRGDVAEICAITPPDIAIVTGVNEAHAERMGGIETATATIFEIAEHAKKNAVMIVNADDGTARTYAQKKYSTALYFGSSVPTLANYKILSSQLDTENLKRIITIESTGQKISIATSILGPYFAADCALALGIAAKLGVPTNSAVQALERLDPVPHRLAATKNQNDIVVIDDSYNGNPAGVRAAALLLGAFTNRRRIYLTPGLVEMGTEAPRVHRELGKLLAPVANLTILIKNSVTPFLAEGLRSVGVAPEAIVWFNTAPEAHQALAKILKPNDVILFQNDWTDNYV